METSNAHLMCTVILMVYSVDVAHNSCPGLSVGSNTVARQCCYQSRNPVDVISRRSNASFERTCTARTKILLNM